ncbi:uncharacterized protein PpBr36_09612 [Pyricularia pennisetigena]|uniref:uncharacterized protein n=1 Tax=Pyricularia pennisetigena TaxID=1578925 RepID=UPI00114DDA27|nr:uncharacterized protein PpBr36_09612 [Pyricularia pennisetigena]TLS21924.1 hypothetical protein PpBr36_09612 [Pyricularia pennisetigena]
MASGRPRPYKIPPLGEAELSKVPSLGLKKCHGFRSGVLLTGRDHAVIEQWITNGVMSREMEPCRVGTITFTGAGRVPIDFGSRDYRPHPLP